MSSQQHHAPRRPLHALLVLFMAAAIGLSTAACGGANAKKADTPAVAGKPAPITAEEVDAMYALYLGGRYDAYVALMLSCDDKPESYRNDMVNLYKQHAADSAGDDSSRAVSAHTKRVEHTDDGRAATAFICVTYADSSHEELMLELQHDGRRWRLR